MELKNYQKEVIDDIVSYIDILSKKGKCSEAYEELWNRKGFDVSFGKVKPYVDTIKGVPDVCLKVPTGGGKTFIACAALKKIFDGMPRINKFVIWMVPSSAILEQTLTNLKDPTHPYRKRLDADFHRNIGVYNIEELLNGQNFNPQIIQEQLTICVLSYSSAKATNIENRRMYRQNGALQQFRYLTDNQPAELGESPTLIGIINALSPVIVLDESHNATSTLSKIMLSAMNPSFILELTATPKETSNKISIITAGTLKKENMVKIPIVVYGRQNVNYVLSTTIDYRNTLEEAAIEEYKKSGRYVRPIALIQAETNTKEGSITYSKIRDDLIKVGIPKEQIAIKVSEKDELKNIKLTSEDCPIRYIITVNALKEGWDCPFAYILSSIAKRSSEIDVKQIVGRILRQPGGMKFENPILNMSYVITSSVIFRKTLESMAAGLQIIGYSKNDIVEKKLEDYNPESQETNNVPEEDTGTGINPEEIRNIISDTKDKEGNEVKETQIQERDHSVNKDEYTTTETFKIDPVEVKQMGERYEKDKEEKGTEKEFEFMKYSRKVKMNPEFKDDALSVKIPYFMYIKKSPLTGETFTEPVSQETLSQGIKLALLDKDIDFTQVDLDVGKWELSKDGVELKYSRLTRDEIQYQQETFKEIKSKDDKMINKFVDELVDILDRKKEIERSDLKKYVRGIIESLSLDTINLLRKNTRSTADKIREKIEAHLKEYRIRKFRDMLKSSKLTTDMSRRKGYYEFPTEIDPYDTGKVPYTKSLYEKYNVVSEMENRILDKINGCENVLWWHRIAGTKNPEEYHLNGPINHYPDFIARTKSGVTVLIEAKGPQLNNADSRLKIEIGDAWEHVVKDSHYKYYMVFEDENQMAEGAISVNKLVEYLRTL